MQIFLQELRNRAVERNGCNDENNFTDAEFQSVAPPTKEQFRHLFARCAPVPRQHGYRYMIKRDLLSLLCKLRQELSDDFLKVIFKYSSRQAVILVVAVAR